MEEKIMPGDLVRLKSGGPTMTVEYEYEGYDGNILKEKKSRQLSCVWFVKETRPAILSSAVEGDEGQFQRMSFNPSALERVKK